MKREDIEYGKKVRYYPTLGVDKFKETKIISDVYEICGTECCKVDCVVGVVAIENLEEI